MLSSAFIGVYQRLIILFFLLPLQAADFHFVILGDRTGEPQPGIYEQLWKATLQENPAFVLTVGDTIQGLDDKTADQEWRDVLRTIPHVTFYLTPGNHDIWSDLSEKLFRKYSGHPPHYSFDHEQAHFTILDNSRDEQFSAAELAYLESDLRAHEKQPIKFVISHRPSWIIDVLLKNPHNAVHQLVKKYGVQYVISGHVHQMIHANLEGIEYLSMPSAGGHLRASMKYEDGWFFAHTVVEITSSEVHFQIKELHNRTTTPADWTASGLRHP
ncbi:MAG TPA: metallophosphoesterase [Bryobacteraceae bacterium]|jgi:Icc protein|nr:metallophosphoesterase [Bryobacteraceae bacterium]